MQSCRKTRDCLNENKVFVCCSYSCDKESKLSFEYSNFSSQFTGTRQRTILSSVVTLVHFRACNTPTLTNVYVLLVYVCTCTYSVVTHYHNTMVTCDQACIILSVFKWHCKSHSSVYD